MNYDKNYLTHLAKGRETQKRTKEQRLLDYQEKPAKCKSCTKAMPFQKRNDLFCSRSCAASFNNKGVNRHGEKCLSTCMQCSKPLKKKSSRTKYCSKDCSSVARKQTTYTEMDKSQEDLSKWATSTRRNYIIQKQGHVCSICGTTEWQKQKVPLVMDHIDGNSNNNARCNLRMICPMCDAQLPTYKGRNLGNGRHTRRMRYKQGKSY